MAASEPFDDFNGSSIPPKLVAAEDLFHTHIFQEALLFLMFLGLTASALLTFFGGGEDQGLGLPSRRKNLTSAATLAFQRSLEHANFNFFNPLRLDVDLGAFRPAINVVVKLLALGWLRTVREGEGYLMHISQIATRSPDVFSMFVSKLLRLSAEARSTSELDQGHTQNERGGDGYIEATAQEKRNEVVQTFIRRREDDVDLATCGPDLDQPHFSGVRAHTHNGESSSTSPSSEFQSSTSTSNPLEQAHHTNSNVNYSTPTVGPPTNSPSTPTSTSPINPPTASYRCRHPSCHKAYSSADKLRRHTRGAHNAKTWTCTQCGKVSSRLDNLRKHWQRVHAEVAVPQWLDARKERGGGGQTRGRGGEGKVGG
ncbi:MAG: hypothetical protein M1833_005745 [Piccolia ochrophora]|nr:MAG: hypothetical protein M1833_005745 [Piccolia ochrophora]